MLWLFSFAAARIQVNWNCFTAALAKVNLFFDDYFVLVLEFQNVSSRYDYKSMFAIQIVLCVTHI